ncbi:MAG: hypothetical protein OEV52_06535 [Dehalococcoidia bacterium]|nr:hypothetical protein [Dehalococcoidia bacterium]
MKKIFGILLVVALVATTLPSIVFAKSPQTEFDLNGPHYNLNLLGKRDSWNDKEVSNPDRHTMFVPMDTTNWDIELKSGANGNKVVNHGNVTANVTSLPGFAIYMTQGGDDFAVVDGTAFDGDACELNLADGKYWVVVAAKAKPVENAPQIDGWAQVYNTTGALYYYLNLGTVTVSRKWVNATDLFFIDAEEASGAITGLPDPGNGNGGLGMWIFDYFDYLDTVGGYDDYAYFWQLQNNGSKLIQVRFYPMSEQ